MSKSASDNGLPVENFEDDLTIDACEALASERRRFVLSILSTTNEPLSIETLARRVGGREVDEPPEQVSDDLFETVHLSLYHVHLPKLSDVGLIDYDEDEKSVGGLTERGEKLTE